MSQRVDFTKENLAWCSLWGVARGICVHTLIYPLEVVKIRQQCAQSESKSARIASLLLQQEGIGAFYKGLAPQLLKTSLKQVWCWPMIAGMPPLLQKHNLDNLSSQTLTGLSIATIDAAISTPLERAKILSAFRGTSQFCLKSAYKDGWKGFGIHWSKLSLNWTAFLTAQKYFRDQSPKKPLSYPELAKIGVQVALTVSLVSAPLDIANTLKQAQNLAPSHLFSRKGIFKMYRGWPLNALALVIHNVASVIVIDKLSKIEKLEKVSCL